MSVFLAIAFFIQPTDSLARPNFTVNTSTQTIQLNGKEVSSAQNTETLAPLLGKPQRNKDKQSVVRYYYDSLGIMTENAPNGKMAYRLAMISDTAVMTAKSYFGKFVLNGMVLKSNSTRADVLKALNNSIHIRYYNETIIMYIDKASSTILTFDVHPDGIHEISFGILGK
jgi:hypothetical protein